MSEADQYYLELGLLQLLIICLIVVIRFTHNLLFVKLFIIKFAIKYTTILFYIIFYYTFFTIIK